MFAEGGQYLRYITEERAVGTDHQYIGPRHSVVGVQEEGGPMEPDRRFSRTRAALYGQHARRRCPDHLVLLGLDRGDDVQHLTAARPLQFDQQRVRPSEVVLGRHHGTEGVVADREDLPAIDNKLTPPGQAHRVRPAGPVKGEGDRSAPLDHDRFADLVIDMASADVPGCPVRRVCAPKAQRPGRAAERLGPARKGPLEVGVGALHLGQEPLCLQPHAAQVLVGGINQRLFGLEVGGARRQWAR